MTAGPTSSPDIALSPNPPGVPGVVSVSRPASGEAVPCVFASPHSGRVYDAPSFEMAAVSRDQLRKSEDAYVDLLIDEAPHYGGTLVCALFPRVFVDVNRADDELDPTMYSDRLPASVKSMTRRVASGLGVVPRVSAEGRALYRRKLLYREARERLDVFYRPYHDALNTELQRLRQEHGCVILFDMHSMPSHTARGADIVIGDRFGTSASPAVVEAVELALRGRDLVTVRNTPYAGGHTTEHYGAPHAGIHVVQIEINRGLYLDESRTKLSDGFSRAQDIITSSIKQLCGVDWSDRLRRAMRPSEAKPTE